MLIRSCTNFLFYATKNYNCFASLTLSQNLWNCQAPRLQNTIIRQIYKGKLTAPSLSMPQKSIALFFSSKGAKKSQESTNGTSPKTPKANSAQSISQLKKSPSPKKLEEDSPIKVKKRKVKAIFSDSEDESAVSSKSESKSPVSQQKVNLKQLKEQKSGSESDETSNPPRDVNVTPNGTVKRKTARKSAQASKRLKLSD
uniref:Uncharacterized protein n=1 Tax=Ciona savignyi TaxID=51511 RepID=H2YDZ1_CIOSA